jgi:hypothetical protein
MDWLVINLAPDGFLDIKVAGLFCILATQWLKRYVPDWRFYNLVALALTLLAQVGAVALVGSGKWFDAAWAGLLGASLATFGYEVLTNLAGWAGVGPRK